MRADIVCDCVTPPATIGFGASPRWVLAMRSTMQTHAGTKRAPWYLHRLRARVSLLGPRNRCRSRSDSVPLHTSFMTNAHRWDVVVVGSANWDFLVRGPSLPTPGGTVRGETFQEAPGGKGANQAVAAARLGGRVAFVGRVGADEYGERIIARLRAERVDTQYVVRDLEGASGVAVIQVGGDGEKQILTAPGANARLSVANVQAARTSIESAAVLLVQLEASLDVVETSARIAHEAGVRVVLDPAPALPLPDSLVRRVHLIRPNAEEAGIVTGVAVHDRATAGEAARVLLRRGVHAAVVQAGPEGDLLVWSHDGAERERWMPRIPVEAIDATGAGDAFAAALAVMVASDRPFEEAGPFASAAAALTTTKLGAQAALPTRDEVDALLRERAARSHAR
jgi:ribokinase